MLPDFALNWNWSFDGTRNEDAQPSQQPNNNNTTTPANRRSGRNAPLVIVSQRGRHSDQSRRIVRAQAARASAAQSRVTRARNREERESTARETPHTPQTPQLPHIPMPLTPQVEHIPGVGFPPAAPETPSASTPSASSDPASQLTAHPLIKWLVGLLDLSPAGLLTTVQNLTVAGPAAVGLLTSTVTSGVGAVLGSVAGLAGLGGSGRPQLPQAVPRGFTTLQQRIQVSDSLVLLVSRTSCFDFGSPGVEERLHGLLYDLILSHAKALLTPILVPGHAIQGHLRIACTCLTIFQGQRADGSVLAQNQKYKSGLDAAWSEALLLDQNALADVKSAEASLWAVFIISVTTGATAAAASSFQQVLYGLFNDLQLRSWKQVRNILLDFIYPVSYLDEPCKSYFDSLQQMKCDVM